METKKDTPEDIAKGVLTSNPVDGTINKRDRKNDTADGGFDPDGLKKLRSNGKRHHDGNDIGGMEVGTDVKASGDGIMTIRVQKDKDGNVTGYGKYITIAHKNGVTTMYAHLKSYKYGSGTKVKAGQVIGKVGRTGNIGEKTKTHLHYEVKVNGKQIDPQPIHNWSMQE